MRIVKVYFVSNYFVVPSIEREDVRVRNLKSLLETRLRTRCVDVEGPPSE